MKTRFLTLCCGLMFAGGFYAQTTQNAVQGYVTDLGGNPVANQAVAIFTDSSQAPIAYWNTVYTDANGFYLDSVWYPAGPAFSFFASTLDCNLQYQQGSDLSSSVPMVINLQICVTPPPACAANFWSYPDSINPNTVNFVDNSTGSIVNWTWNFGDGNFSYIQNPSHTYNNPGTYTVCLVVDDGAGCIDSTCTLVTVNAPPPACNAYWTSSTWYPSTSTPVNFYDYSSGNIVNWTWDFGDGSPLVYTQNATHTYSNPGAYTICLTIDDGAGCIDTYCDSMYVSTGCNAQFTLSANGNTITGTNTSTSGYSYDWLIWDPSANFSWVTNSTNLSYNATINGTYNVCLYAYDSLGNFCDSTCQNVTVTGAQSCAANFWWFPDSVNSTLIWVINASTGNNLSYYWDFGDGNYSTQAYPTHIYAATGPYNLCLIINSSNPSCTDTMCQSITLKTATGMTINITAPTGTEDITSADVIGNVFPNPANDRLFVPVMLSNDAAVSCRVMDYLGRELIRTDEDYKAGDHTLAVPVNTLPAGIYYVTVQTPLTPFPVVKSFTIVR